jgi:hypothetical protein
MEGQTVKRIFMLLVILLISFTAFAASVTVVYLDRTETNLEASSYIKKQAKKNKLSHKFKFASSIKSLKGNEEVVVILNSNLRSGTDSRISEYLNSVQNKNSIILVNLYSIGNKILMNSITSANSPNGVDEVSSASIWDDRNRAINEMHKQWTSELFRLINIKQAM